MRRRFQIPAVSNSETSQSLRGIISFELVRKCAEVFSDLSKEIWWLAYELEWDNIFWSSSMNSWSKHIVEWIHEHNTSSKPHTHIVVSVWLCHRIDAACQDRRRIEQLVADRSSLVQHIVVPVWLCCTIVPLTENILVQRLTISLYFIIFKIASLRNFFIDSLYLSFWSFS